LHVVLTRAARWVASVRLADSHLEWLAVDRETLRGIREFDPATTLPSARFSRFAHRQNLAGIIRVDRKSRKAVAASGAGPNIPTSSFNLNQSKVLWQSTCRSEYSDVIT
jgi:hypothetical protein